VGVSWGPPQEEILAAQLGTARQTLQSLMSKWSDFDSLV